MSGNITLKELAKMAGVSVSTVSKALANSSEISDATKDKIKELAKECHYRPNYIAQSLKSSSTKTIGVIIPDILNFFFVKILHSIEETGRKMGYKIVTCISNESLQTEKENIDILTNGSVDGLILSVTTETQKLNEYKHIQQVINNQLPVVLFDRVTDTLNCCRITSDNYQGAFMAVEYFIDMGCKNIGVFVTNKDLGVVKERVKGALDVLENRGIKGRTKIFEISDIEDDKSIKSYLKTYQLDAVFSVDERLAIKIIKAAKQLNIEIPKELKIIGFADGILSKEYSPSLSTVDLHAEKIGALAVSQIIEKISKEPLKNEQQEILVEVKPTLIHRESA